MIIEYYYFMLAVLIPRLFTQWSDQSMLQIKNLIWVLVAEIVLLLPLFSIKQYALLIPFLLVFHALQYVLHHKGVNPLPKRIIELVFLIFLSSFIFGIFLKDITFNIHIVNFLVAAINHNALIPQFDMILAKKGIIYLLGVILLVNEINNIIRYVLNLLKTEPLTAESKNYTPDSKELDRGKMIGVIERVLFFFFVITNNYASIAFILTAKGVTRFKELDDKNFAEYVLIGTLLSSSMAIFCAVLITELVKTVK